MPNLLRDHGHWDLSNPCLHITGGPALLLRERACVSIFVIWQHWISGGHLCQGANQLGPSEQDPFALCMLEDNEC